MESEIKENLERVKDRIDAACLRTGRSAGEVTIVAVTKTHGPEFVDAVIAAGVPNVGENRIQEFLGKKDRVERPCRWHLVGTLQRNKATKAVGQFVLIQSLDRLKLAETLSRLSVERGIDTRTLIEVNTSGESTKHGAAPDEVIDLAGAVRDLPGLALDGLMTIGPLTDDEAAVRRSFIRLRELKERAETELGGELPHLSMGMSDDFEVAVEEGATIVRLGRVLFGERG
jgi:pyridoxal phosphate enzyme (YggS family)